MVGSFASVAAPAELVKGKWLELDVYQLIGSQYSASPAQSLLAQEYAE